MKSTVVRYTEPRRPFHWTTFKKTQTECGLLCRFCNLRQGAPATAAACSLLHARAMGAKTVEDLVAFQLALEFKLEVYRLLDACGTPRDFKYQSQLRGAPSDIEANLAEGFARNVSGEFAQFVRYADASLAEARRRLRDGVDRKYFSEADCRAALGLGKRCADATRNLHRSLEPFLRKRVPRGRRP